MKKDLSKVLYQRDAVIFDLDGTLVDSMWMWKAIDIEYLNRFGITYQEGLQQKIEGMSFTETAVFFKEYFGIPDSIEKMKCDWNDMAIDKYTNEVPLKPGAYRLLNDLKEHRIKTGIATSNSIQLVSAVLKSLKIFDMIDTVVTGCEVTKGKPSPDIYLEASRRLCIEPDKCIVFEDILPGIVAGKSAGMYVFAVDDPYSEDVIEEKKKLADDWIHDYMDFFH